MYYETNIVYFIKKYRNTKNTIVINNVPPAKATAINRPKTNNGIAIYCIINGKKSK